MVAGFESSETPVPLAFSEVVARLCNEQDVASLDLAKFFIRVNSETFPFHGDIDGFDGSASLSRRVILRFPAGFDVIVATDGDAFVSAPTTDVLSIATDLCAEHQITYSETSNPHVVKLADVSDATDAIEVVGQLLEHSGQLEILLPWESSFDNFLDQAEDLELDDYECTKKDLKAVIKLSESIGDGVQWPNIEVCAYNANVPVDSAYLKLERLYGAFDDSRWIVLAEECCSGCAAGTIKSRIEASNGKYTEQTPVFATWGQGSAYDYHADGSLNVAASVWAEDKKYIAEAAELATKCGLGVEIGETLGLS